MKIALVAPLVAPLREPQMGGAQALLADLARGLSERGHRVEVYAAGGSAIPGVTVVETGIDAARLRASRIVITRRAPAAGQAGGEAMEAAFAGIAADLDRRDFALAHNHAFDVPAIRQLAGLKLPVVHTLHMTPVAAMAGALAQAAGGKRPPVVACVSEAQARDWRRLARIDAVLPNGVPTARIPWSASPGVGAVFAGRFSPEKGAAEAIAIARAAGVPLALYGDAYDAVYAREKVYSHRGQPGIAIFPAQPRAQLWEIMQRAAALLCPSNWEEPFGLAPAEAQACGTPVVGFRRGGLAEVVADGKTGFLVPAGNIAAAASALQRAATLSRAGCRRHAELTLDLGRCLDAHERLYSQFMQSSAGSGLA